MGRYRLSVYSHGPRQLSQVALLCLLVALVGSSAHAGPLQVLARYPDSFTLGWSPFSADWDRSQVMPYPAPSSYLTGKPGYVRHFLGPSDGEQPKLIQSFTYRSLSGQQVSAALALAIWGYRVSWFEEQANGYVYGGSFVVPALWIREKRKNPDGSVETLYHEAKQSRYCLSVPPSGKLKPDTDYWLEVEPLHIVLHSELQFEESPVCPAPVSPLLPSDLTFLPLPILSASGPDWYYGLSRLTLELPQGWEQSAVAGPPLIALPPQSRERYHYEGQDFPRDDPPATWRSFTYWWYGQPRDKGNGQGGTWWYPVCGPVGYVGQPGLWSSFGAFGPRVGVVVEARTKPVPLEVLRTSPTNGERGVSLTVRVEIQFNKRLTGARPEHIRWRDSRGNQVDYGWQIDGDTLLLWPHQPLRQNTDYRVVIRQGAVQAYAQALPSDFELTFSTRPPSGGGGGGGGGLIQ